MDTPKRRDYLREMKDGLSPIKKEASLDGESHKFPPLPYNTQSNTIGIKDEMFTTNNSFHTKALHTISHLDPSTKPMTISIE